jgi:hypothetical protein
MPLRHFPFKHPTFGTSKTPKTSGHWRVSVYYWWYEYLKRNKDYRDTCSKGGAGKCSDLYQHFGDVHSHDFKTWWTKGERGANLFAEPPTPSIQVLSDGQVVGGDQNLVISVPLGLPITALVKSFRTLLSKKHDGKRGKRRMNLSTAKFLPKGKIDVAFLEIALSVWDERTTNPTKPLWQVAHDVGIAGKHKIKSTDSEMIVRDKKNVLGAMTSRYFKKASLMIASVGKGRFPH